MIIITTPERLDDTPSNNNAAHTLEGMHAAPDNAEASAASSDGCSAGVACTVEGAVAPVNTSAPQTSRVITYINVHRGTVTNHISRETERVVQYTKIEPMPHGANADLERIRRTRILADDPWATPAEKEEITEYCVRVLVECDSAATVPLFLLKDLLALLDEERAQTTKLINQLATGVKDTADFVRETFGK
jgi:hypothetical protein